MLNVLGPEVKIIILQFCFSNHSIVPNVLKNLGYDQVQNRAVRGPKTGVQIVRPTEKTSLKYILKNLTKNGYDLVEAFYQPSVDQRHKKTYHLVRFIFKRNEDVVEKELYKEFVNQKKEIFRELGTMCTRALWRIRVYINPFYKNNAEVEGQFCVSMNADARMPLFDNKGERLVRWERDPFGERIGNAPKPLMAENYLNIIDEEIKVLPN